MPLGHHPFLRGYAPAEAIGDRGLAFKLEASHQGRASDNQPQPLRPFAFVSGGRVSTEAPAGATASGHNFASIGLGVRGQIGRQASVEFWGALPLRQGPLSEDLDPAFYLFIGTQW